MSKTACKFKWHSMYKFEIQIGLDIFVFIRPSSKEEVVCWLRAILEDLREIDGCISIPNNICEKLDFNKSATALNNLEKYLIFQMVEDEYYKYHGT